MRILLVDDHDIVREGMRRLLLDEFPAAVIAEASTAQVALDLVRKEPWSLVVLDVSLPGRGGLEALKDIRAERPGTPVLMVTMYTEDQYALRAFRAGAAGYLTKANASAELLPAVHKIASGGKYVTPSVAEKLAASLTRDTGAPLHDALSDRELQVLRMMATGKTVKEIGHELSLSEKTVSTYRTRVLEKLSLKTTAELIRYAIRAHLVD